MLTLLVMRRLAVQHMCSRCSTFWGMQPAHLSAVGWHAEAVQGTP